MRKPELCLTIVTFAAAACLVVSSSNGAFALKAGGAGASDGACMEQFYECQRSCGPSPSTANPACMKYCEEQVLAKCKAGGGGGAAAVKGTTVKPAVKGTLKSTP